MPLVPILVALPLGLAFIFPLLPKRRIRLCDTLAVLGSAVLVVLSLLTIGRNYVYEIGGWYPPIGINLVLDGFSSLMVIVVSIVSFAALLFSCRYMDTYTQRPKYYCLFMLMIAGMNGAILTGDMFNFYVFLEIAALSSYALVAFGCQHEELEASFKYGILGSVASSFVLLAIALLYSQFGTVNMAHLSQKIAAAGAAGPTGTVVPFCLMLIIAGLGLKAALVPFHAWLPDAHPSAPAPISAMLSGVLIKAIGVYGLVRIIFNVFGLDPKLSYALMILGTLSMVIGVFMAIGQWDYKRLLAYHSISQIGYVMLGIGLGTPLGILGGIFHLANHAVFKSLLFLTAGAVEHNTGTRQLQEMGGLNKKMPTTGATSLVASMSIAGIPPFNGFFSKLIIILACIQAGRYGFATWAVVVSIMTLASFMKVQKYGFFGKLKDHFAKLREVPATMQASMIFLAVLCLAMSLMLVPSIRGTLLQPACNAVQQGLQYSKTVLPEEWVASPNRVAGLEK
ncbi:MAG: NADH/ubiquinone/plastoquinone (complex I) [Candidatus Coatesbacteria bacterium]|nr:NADH/ubiquinone/plastoquinone (complex I) [Candidatus Coatesbacteria bacterium]